MPLPQYEQLGELPRRSSGESWTEAEDEKLRLAYLDLCRKMIGRSPAAVFARINQLRERRYYQWPETGEDR